MEAENGLKIGGIYYFKMKKRNFGKCIYLGRRQGDGIVYRNIVALRRGEFVFDLVFDSYALIGETLVVNSNRRVKLSSSQREYLDERLKKVGL